ncbi:NAD/NADP-dependent octopine/nopaline dehydrogenase family protein [Kineobactrum salinum]|uniref:Glycerol-3-phosphate dehydrogenase n=1 Tax=Kineobactrum salinum TaxID=2708301 RepID=A0A6C0U2V4_9GAMM|nr:NAD/NADP-dependent octopine/nopaline dehydrogenase family protein [Kineobactrum salinum]QIB66500.1 glycerol-3-phosphate dehydrogenase [Kineobactrum salinum]
MRVTVVGGGHGCYAAAAEMAEKGHNVRLWRRDKQALESLSDAGAITLVDHRGRREVPLERITASLAEAVDDAELVIIPLPATTHQSLSVELAPLWQSGQVVYLPPGTFGSYLFMKTMREAGNEANVSFAETGTLPYLARKHGDREVVVSAYATRLPTGVFPSRNSDRALAVLRKAYPSIEPVEDALSGALMNAGPIIHPPLILMNAGPLEYFPSWDIHNEGTQPAIRRVTDALDAERIALREALGYVAPHFPLADHYSAGGDEWMYGNAAHEKLTDSGDWREKIELEQHRYMLEDTRLGLSLMVSLGRWLGLATPVAEGLMVLGSAVTGRDFYAEGRTLESMGLNSLDLAGFSGLLREGI